MLSGLLIQCRSVGVFKYRRVRVCVREMVRAIQTEPKHSVAAALTLC